MSSRMKSEPLDNDPIAMETGDEEDEIVREIDVYFSPELRSQLHLIQFPLQHGSVSVPQAARIKPKHGLLELDQPIPHTHHARHNLPDSLNLSHRTHVSHTIPVSTHMALGKMEVSPGTNGAALHLVPLSHIFQMRPDFGHIDEALSPQNPDYLHAEHEEESKKLEKKPVMFQKKESERAALARQNSYAYKRASEEAEEWQYLNVHGPGTLTYAQTRQAIHCSASPSTQQTNVPQPSQDDSANYVHSLKYMSADAFRVKTETLDGTGTGSEADFTLRQLCTKLTQLLHRGWPVPFSVLRARFPSSSVDDHSLVTALSSCAVLVRGNFVLQSRLLTLPGPIQQARTFLSYLIQKFGYVQRYRLDHVYNGDAVVTPEVIHMLLQQVATKCLNGWQPKLEDDVTFCQGFPEQTQMHLHYWERQGTRMADLVEKYQQAPLE